MNADYQDSFKPNIFSSFSPGGLEKKRQSHLWLCLPPYKSSPTIVSGPKEQSREEPRQNRDHAAIPRNADSLVASNTASPGDPYLLSTRMK